MTGRPKDAVSPALVAGTIEEGKIAALLAALDDGAMSGRAEPDVFARVRRGRSRPRETLRGRESDGEGSE